MGVRESLEANVEKNNLLRTRSQVRRAVLCLWEEGDQETTEFCQKIALKNYGIMIPLKEIGNAKERVIEKWKECQKRERNKEIKYFAKPYLLVIDEYEKFNEELSELQNFIIEYCRLEDVSVHQWRSLNWGKRDSERQNNEKSFVQWHVNKNDSKAVSEFLRYMEYSEKELSKSTGEYWLQYQEYNAIREDSCNYFIKLLNLQLEPKKLEQDVLERIIMNKSFVNQIQKKYPHPRDFPLSGYNHLSEKLELQYKKNLAQRIRMFWNKFDIKISISIQEALEILYGEENGKPKTEYLREIINKREILEYCKQVYEENFQLIREQLELEISLYNIIVRLKNYLDKWKRRIEKGEENVHGMDQAEYDDMGIEELENCIKRILETEFSPKSLEPEDVFKGLSEYFELWEIQNEKYIKRYWLEQIAGMVVSTQNEYQEKYDKLMVTRNIFENSRIQSSEEFEFEPQYVEEKYIRNEKMLMEQINGYVSNAKFSIEHAKRIIRMADTKYQKTEDYNVSSIAHPEIHFIYSNIFGRESLEVESNFAWKFHPVDYLSESMFCEFKIYKL